MSWKYLNTSDADGKLQKQSVMRRSAGFWRLFEQNRPVIETALAGEAARLDAGSIHTDVERALRLPDLLSKWFDQQVRQIDPRLHWEVGQWGGGFYIAITAGMVLPLRPMQQEIVAAAPQIAGWNAIAYRPPIQAHWAIETVRLRSGLSASAPLVMARLGKFNRIDLTFKMVQARSDEVGARQVAAALAEAVLGEEAFLRWVGEIDAEPLDRGPANNAYLGLAQLRSTVIGLVQTINRSLPQQAIFARPAPAKWPTFKLEPTPAADFPGQEDVTVGRSIVPAIRSAAMGEGAKPARFPFYSASFSRAGEQFCYLKLDVPGVEFSQRRRQKYAVEDLIDPMLRRCGTGCVVGSSTGLRYIYIDLAVVDLAKAVGLMRPALGSLGIAPRSWLLFCDSELAEEYIGLLPDSPPPPQPRPTAFFRFQASPKPAPAAVPAPVPITELLPDELLF